MVYNLWEKLEDAFKAHSCRCRRRTTRLELGGVTKKLFCSETSRDLCPWLPMGGLRPENTHAGRAPGTHSRPVSSLEQSVWCVTRGSDSAPLLSRISTNFCFLCELQPLGSRL